MTQRAVRDYSCRQSTKIGGRLEDSESEHRRMGGQAVMLLKTQHEQWQQRKECEALPRLRQREQVKRAEMVQL